jgi:hypothetical protein
MKKFEYKYIEADFTKPEDLVAIFNTEGQERWQLVFKSKIIDHNWKNVIYHCTLYFMREV